MSLSSGIVAYLIIWWMMLFIVLPFGVQTAEEANEELEAGLATSAPVKPRIWQKFAITTVLAAVVFAGYWGVVTYDPWGIGSYITGLKPEWC